MVPSRRIIRILKDNGWVLLRIDGSHHQFTDPPTGRIVTILHPKKEISSGLLKGIEKSTGLKFR